MSRCEHGGQVHIAFVRVLLPAKHRIHTPTKLGAAGLVDATCVNPEVQKTVAGGLFSAEFDLFVASLILASAFHKVYERDFLYSPGMRQYGILRNSTIILLHQTQSRVLHPSEDASLCVFTARLRSARVMGRYENGDSLH